MVLEHLWEWNTKRRMEIVSNINKEQEILKKAMRSKKYKIETGIDSGSKREAKLARKEGEKLEKRYKRAYDKLEARKQKYLIKIKEYQAWRAKQKHELKQKPTNKPKL